MQEPTDALATTARQLAALHDILQSERDKVTGLSIDVVAEPGAGSDPKRRASRAHDPPAVPPRR